MAADAAGGGSGARGGGALRQLLDEAKWGGSLLPVAINAMEDHRTHVEVQTEVARLLAALAEHVRRRRRTLRRKSAPFGPARALLQLG